jgi:hypothetical protein
MRMPRCTSFFRRLASVAVAGLTLMIPNVRAATIEIDGDFLNNKPTWLVNGRPATAVAVNPGDTVVWKAANGTHGVVFDTQAAAESVLEFQSGALPALGQVTVGTEVVWGTKPQPQGTVLARATVKAGVAPGDTLGFFCSQHGRNMSGALTIADAGGNPPPPGKKTLPPPSKQLPIPGKQTQSASTARILGDYR